MAKGDECISRMRRLRWLKESNAMAEGDECDGRRRRMRWLEETEHEPLNRFYTIPHRDNNIKIVVFYLFTLRFPLYSTMLSGLSEIPTNHFFFQFSFFENIGNMTTNRSTAFIEHLRNI